MSVLEQTKGKIKIEGKVVGIKNENAYREGFTQSDKPYKSLQFFVQTSPTNRVKVEMFGMERDEVIFYNSKERKSTRVAWDKRGTEIKGAKLLGSNLYLEGSGEKKTRKVLVEFDAIDYILEHVKDDDSVRIGGSIDFGQFEDSEGKKKNTVKFPIGSITKIADIDFEAENFKEIAQFEQDIVVNDKMVDDETKKLLISAYVINYKKEGNVAVDADFIVDGATHPKLANNMSKRLEFGDLIKVYGLIRNETIQVLAEPDESEEVDEEDDWGGDEEIASAFDNNYINEFINELKIISVDSSSYEKAKYTEEDFINEDEDAFNGDNESFDEDENKDEEDIDNLPFG